ncbi:hypothetical protein CDAR_62901 [Caerostris darwini]|uniref:Uncharacterized protein n=1 Tax=Caerostris darwini TaxID=1538125 RepID=A0AAV4UFX1_9ARAC|nr:hypothetical protein CDAR_62901 [Caerostris darwini]
MSRAFEKELARNKQQEQEHGHPTNQSFLRRYCQANSPCNLPPSKRSSFRVAGVTDRKGLMVCQNRQYTWRPDSTEHPFLDTVELTLQKRIGVIPRRMKLSEMKAPFEGN